MNTSFEVQVPTDADGILGERAELASQAAQQIYILCRHLLRAMEGVLDEDTFVTKALVARAFVLADACMDMLVTPADQFDLTVSRQEIEAGHKSGGGSEDE